MFEFLKIQYTLGKVTAEQLQTLIDLPLGITEEQYKEITKVI